jgi:hypothetical protein
MPSRIRKTSLIDTMSMPTALFFAGSGIMRS